MHSFEPDPRAEEACRRSALRQTTQRPRPPRGETNASDHSLAVLQTLASPEVESTCAISGRARRPPRDTSSRRLMATAAGRGTATTENRDMPSDLRPRCCRKFFVSPTESFETDTDFRNHLGANARDKFGNAKSFREMRSGDDASSSPVNKRDPLAKSFPENAMQPLRSTRKRQPPLRCGLKPHVRMHEACQSAADSEAGRWGSSAISFGETPSHLRRFPCVGLVERRCLPRG